MKCCGCDCSTPFCPLCGKQLQVDPLRELLHYARSQVRARETDLKKKEAGIKRCPDRHWPEQAEKKRENLLKWTAWCDALAAKVD